MLVDGRSGPGDQVTAAIRSASRTTGATFDYLLNTAIRESSLDPKARASTSTARGLYQFIESTWLTMVKEEGAKFGLGRYADAIQRGSDGQYKISDPAARAKILKMREDPQISSLMAGALAKRNSAELQASLGRKPTPGELYLAHFLGAGGAKRLIELQKTNPNASAAAAFPDAARANKSIFHRADGKARSIGEVVAGLTSKHKSAPAAEATTRLAETRPTARTKTARAETVPQPARFAELRPTLSSDPVSRTRNGPAPRETYAHPVNPGRSAFAPEDGPAFEAMFRTSDSNSPISPAVRELWGSMDATSRGLNEAATGAVKQASVSKPGAIGEPLDLLAHLRRPTTGR
jgi:hypothetical protein